LKGGGGVVGKCCCCFECGVEADEIGEERISCEMLWERWTLKQLLGNKVVAEETGTKLLSFPVNMKFHCKPAHFGKVYWCVITHLLFLFLLLIPV
jgi:hypothetical protein